MLTTKRLHTTHQLTAVASRDERVWRHTFLILIGFVLLTTPVLAETTLIFGNGESILQTTFQLIVNEDRFPVTPVIQTSIEDNSTWFTPINQGSYVTFTANATDPQGGLWYLLVCNGTIGTTSGSCNGNELCRSGYVLTGTNGTCQYATTNITAWNQSWFGYACNNETNCDGEENATAPFFVNHAPSVATSLTPAVPTIDDTLTCSPLLSDPDPGDTPTATYRWWRSNEGTGSMLEIAGQTLNTLIFPEQDSNDRLLCEALPTDSFGFSGNASNSSAVTIANGTLTAEISTDTLFANRTIPRNITLTCGVVIGDSVLVNVTIQDNSTGSWLESSTIPAIVYVNESFRELGAIVNTSTSINITFFSDTIGTYDLRALCQASDATPGNVTSAILTINVTTDSDPPLIITGVDDGSTDSTPTNESENVTFTAQAEDPEGDNWYFTVCASEGATSGTCTGATLCTSLLVANGTSTSCQWNTTGVVVENYEWWAYLCDNSSVCGVAINASSPVVVNHRPVTNPYITPASPSVSDTLSCVANVTEDDTGDTVSNTFRWWLNNEGLGVWAQLGETSNQLESTDFDSNDQVLCQVRSTDNHGFPSTYTNSSAVTVSQGTLSASLTVTSSPILRWKTTTVQADCTVTNGGSGAVTLVIQDDSSGVFAQSSTTPVTSRIWVNQSSFSLGAVNGETSATMTATVFGNTTGSYQFRAQCQASDTTPTSVNSATDTLTVNADTVAPIISNLILSPTNQSAVATWTTDDYATSRIDYGLTTALGSSVIDASYLLSHSITATSLSENTAYYYNITTCNVDGYCNVTGPNTFTTTGPEQAFPSEGGYCTGRFIERGPNPVEGKITKGDVFEYWCETPYSLRPRMPFEIDLVVESAGVNKELRVPLARTGSQTAIYP